jgi:hypothetical protein
VELTATARRSADKADHVVPVGLQEGDESRADEAAGTSNRDAHGEH